MTKLEDLHAKLQALLLEMNEEYQRTYNCDHNGPEIISNYIVIVEKLPVEIVDNNHMASSVDVYLPVSSMSFPTLIGMLKCAMLQVEKDYLE